jgi:hypothetical protein
MDYFIVSYVEIVPNICLQLSVTPLQSVNVCLCVCDRFDKVVCS